MYNPKNTTTIMAKVFGLNGLLTGKLGNQVMLVRNGVQMARQYNPAPFNPNTTAQIEARAKLKEASQLSTIMAPVIAMPRKGMVSTRNQFVKKNYGAITYSDNTATVSLTDVKITNGIVSFPAVRASRGEGTTAEVHLVTGVPVDVTRVVYCAFFISPDNELRYLDSVVVTEPGTSNTWPGEIAKVGQPMVIYAYGVRDNTEAARVAFGNITVPSAGSVATLIVSRTLTEADVTITETQAYLLAAV